MTGCAAIIPARYASTRLPGKALLKDTGKYLIQHVYERVVQARTLDRVMVATDDVRIIFAVREFGGEAVMTSPNLPSGSDRVAEVAEYLDARIIVNVQGDEPDISPDLIDSMVKRFDQGDDVRIVTAAVPIENPADYRSPHVVKVVVSEEGRALYFSRAPIPHNAVPGEEPQPLKHIGVYAFQRETLLQLTRLPPAALERLEKLEQLRALSCGMTIHVLLADRDHLGIDTPEEYESFVKKYKQGIA
ncbi:MAG: 3-deoxy-manno-octulosonate cytidylyltransferase [Planctomycetota bacterium]